MPNPRYGREFSSKGEVKQCLETYTGSASVQRVWEGPLVEAELTKTCLLIRARSPTLVKTAGRVRQGVGSQKDPHGF